MEDRMPKLAWDAFVTKHKTGICVFTTTAHWAAKGKTPPGLTPTGRKWPTAYGMLSTILEKHVKSDWSIRAEKPLIHILLSDHEDLKLLGKEFEIGPGKPDKYKNLCRETWAFMYETEHYMRFAKSLGLVLAQPMKK